MNSAPPVVGTYLGVTFGVSCRGNIAALNLCLLSVLLGRRLPRSIVVRLEGDFPSFANFYLEQLAELARLKRVEWSLHVCTSGGVRAAREWMLTNCPTTYLWMGDDDVVYDPDCLAQLMEGVESVNKMDGETTLAYVCGSKADVNNRRGYADFSKGLRFSSQVVDDAPTCFIYGGRPKTVRQLWVDTGNVLLHVANLRTFHITFTPFVTNHNCVGSDSLFGLQCHHAGMKGYFRSRANAHHLEKEKVGLTEFAARKTILLRECELLGISTSNVASFMPWVN